MYCAAAGLAQWAKRKEDKMERNRLNITKRLLLLFLVFWITFISIFNAYKTTTYCAEWVAGTMAAIAGAPITTALLIGGVVVVGGIALYELSQTTVQDHQNFVDGVKQGFQEFVADQEKQIALENNQSLTDQEAANIGVENARNTVNNFGENVLNVTRTTGRTLKTNTVEYWKKFCKVFNNVSDNGISESSPSDLLPNTVVQPSCINKTGKVLTGADYMPPTILGDDCRKINGYWYQYKGKYANNNFTFSNTNAFPFLEIRVNTDSNDKVTSYRFYLCYYQTNGQIYEQWNSASYQLTANSWTIQKQADSLGLNWKTFIVENSGVNNFHNELKNNNAWKTILAITGTASTIPIWARTINNTLNNTHYGEAIRTGRRQRINAGDYVGSTFKEDSLPIKKTGVRVIDNAITGNVGWDIPNDRVWDDVFSGGKPVGDVIGGTGVYQVPKDAVVDYPTPYDVTFPKDTVVDDVDDPPIDTPWDEPLDPDVPDPDRPIEDIIDENEGEFYPTALDWTTIFPFCIPFDIIYLVDKFNVRGQAPVITLPIVYPTSIRGAMGSDRYEVVIDFNDYVTIRNIIRVFLILLFIAGLMKITRNLIRG